MLLYTNIIGKVRI